MEYTEAGRFARRCRPLLLGLAVAGLWSGAVSAFEIGTGNEDVTIRWDNTIKYNAGWRMEGRDRKLADAWHLQAGEYQFDKGDMVTNRFDLLSEFDFSYKKLYGFRVSGSAWNDFAYDSKVRGNPAYQNQAQMEAICAAFGHPGTDCRTAYPGNKFPNSVKRYYTHSAEFLDAFVFGRVFEQGDANLDVKAGRHTVYWGEALFSPIHGVSYSQGPVDFRKAMATPGTEAKELFLPLNQISAHANITEGVSVAAQYYLEWKPYRIYEGGTYFTYADPFFQGGTTYLGTPYIADANSGPFKRPDNRGSWGVNTKWAADFGTLGFYYRKFDDKVMAVLIDPNGNLSNAYAKDVKLYGVSYSTQLRSLGGIALGTEIVRRENTALNSNFGGTGMARGDTWHALANIMGFVGKTPLFDSAVVLAELTYSRLDSVKSSTKQWYWATGYSCPGPAGSAKGSKDDGCSTKDAWGLAMNFTPTWYQALPSMDLSMPIHYDRGLKGNSPVPFGGNQGSGSWSIGLSADYRQAYTFTLAYTDYFGRYTASPYMFGPNGMAIPGIGDRIIDTQNGGNAVLKDRGWLSFTFKTTF